VRAPLPAPLPGATLHEIERHELRLLERENAVETARTNPWLRPIGPVLGRP
jgi:hypothetical protein